MAGLSFSMIDPSDPYQYTAWLDSIDKGKNNMLVKIKRTLDGKNASFIINPNTILGGCLIEKHDHMLLCVEITNKSYEYIFEKKDEAESALDELVNPYIKQREAEELRMAVLSDC